MLFCIVAGGVALFLVWLGYRLGHFFGSAAAARLIAAREQELFTAQKSFKNLYEQELSELKKRTAAAEERARSLEARVEDYRKKAAGFGGLFGSGNNKRADAMYALLLENEALEEALMQQNEKLRQERTDAVKEQLRQTGYRRILMSQLLADDRIKGLVGEVISDDRRLPAPSSSQVTGPPSGEGGR